jgi:membrane fusion protein (multidrug efflux system)
VLVELDSEAEKWQLAEERARLASVEPKLEALRNEVHAEELALSSDRVATVAALGEGRAQQEAASLDARLAADEAKRLERLHESGAIAEMDFLHARADAMRKRKSNDALRLDVRRIAGERRTREDQALAHIAELRLRMAELEGERAESSAKIGVLEAEVAKRVMRAPCDGTVGEIAPEHPVGSFVRAGDRLGAIIPDGHLVAVADFAPDDALGLIRSGQRGRMRLEAYPWAQYGTLPVTVRNVATEAHDGRVRVELDVEPNGNPRIPLEHGLPGSIEVDVEKSSPARLALRYAGQRLGALARVETKDGT